MHGLVSVLTLVVVVLLFCYFVILSFCCFSNYYLLRVSNDFNFSSDTMGAVASAVAAGVMFAFSLSAAGAVKNTLQNDKDLIESIPLDEEVKKADEELEKKNSVYTRVTIWNTIPIGMRLILILALLTMMGCCDLLVFFNAQCFQEYDLMYTIQQNLGGNWTNIVLPLGRVALLLFAISYGLLYTFESWATVSI